jgi:phosphoglycerate dehydrogenase-like enzyme
MREGVNLKWLNTIAAGIESFPLDVLKERGVVFTNGAGLNAVPIAEYVVMGMLVIAKGYREVARSQERKEWLLQPPGTRSLEGTSMLIVGAGGIGQRVRELLGPWGVSVTEVRRSASDGALGPDEWRARLGEFDWVLCLVPSSSATEAMFGEAEFTAMKQGAAFLNFARGELADQDALMASLDAGHLGAAFLDVAVPEPLPADHPLWNYDNVHISSHLSGRSQETLFRLGAERFLENLGRWKRGEPLAATVDYDLGY